MGVTNAGLARCGVGRLPLVGGPRFFFWLVMGTRRTTDVLPRLGRHGHVELDRRELLGRLADLAQERQPARIVVEIGEQRVDRGVSQTPVLLGHRLVEPLQVTLPENTARRRASCFFRSAMVAFSAQGSNLQCVSFTVLRVAVFSSDSPVSEGRQLNTTWPVPGSSNSISPVSMRGTKLSMYATSSSVASAGSSNCSRPHPSSSISRVRSMFLPPRAYLPMDTIASQPAAIYRQTLPIFSATSDHVHDWSYTGKGTGRGLSPIRRYWLIMTSGSSRTIRRGSD